MKKILLVLGVAIALASCGNTSDCDCTVKGSGADVTLPTIKGYEGNCSDMDWADLPADWQDGAELDLTFKCVDN